MSSSLESAVTGPPIEVPAVPLEEKGVSLYSGYIRAKDLLAVYSIKAFADDLNWYQRGLFEKKARDMASYIKRCPIAVIPSILLSHRTGVEVRNGDSRGTPMLVLARRKGAVNVIDGQHRVAGFARIQEELRSKESAAKLRSDHSKSLKDEIAELRGFLEYQIPVTIVDIKSALKVAKANAAPHFEGKDLEPEDAERVIFFILNKTQKGLNPTLRDQLAYRVWFSGIRGIPAIEEQRWRPYATRIVEQLKSESGPLREHIVDARSGGMGRRVRLSSFVTSIGDLFDNPVYWDPETDERDEAFRDKQHERDYVFLVDYWETLMEMFPNAFNQSSQNLLLRTLGVYAVNWLASDVFRWGSGSGGKVPRQFIRETLKPIAKFDWSRANSPIRAFGGEQGAVEAYRLLLRSLSKAGNKDAAKALRDQGEAI